MNTKSTKSTRVHTSRHGRKTQASLAQRAAGRATPEFDWPCGAGSSNTPEEIVRHLDAAITYLQSDAPGKIRPGREKHRLIAFARLLRERFSTPGASRAPVAMDVLSVEQITDIDRLKAEYQSGFAAQLAIARAMWTSHRALVEAPHFPEGFRMSFARSKRGFELDSGIGPYFSDKHDPLSIKLDEECLRDGLELDIQVDAFFGGSLFSGEEEG